MKRFKYTCTYLVGENGYRADSIADAVGSKTTDGTAVCTCEAVLQTLLTRWNRQGKMIYSYYLTEEDVAHNQQADHIAYRDADPSERSEIAYCGHQQHDYYRIKEVS